MHPIIKTKDRTYNSFKELKRNARLGIVGPRVIEGTYPFTTNTGLSGKVQVIQGSSYSTKTKKRQADGKRKRCGGGRIASGSTGFNVKLVITYEKNL